MDQGPGAAGLTAMDGPEDPALEHLFDRGLFDAVWYGRNHDDVRGSGMGAALHFRRYGFRLLGRAPNAQAARDPALLKALRRPPPAPGQEAVAAHRIAEAGQPATALAYAGLHVPAHHAHVLQILGANAALARGDRAGWLAGLNACLDHFGMAPVALRDGAGPLLDRLRADPGAPVTGGPIVSVIMPVRNAAGTVGAAIRSILDQSWRNLELIVIDDASTDATWSVLTDLAARDGRVVLRRNPVDVGPYVAKNLGVTMARGGWITGHDADDWAHPRRIARHMGAVLAMPTVPRASLTRMIRMRPDGHFDTVTARSEFSPDGVTRRASISALYSARFLRDRLGFWDSVRYGADSEMIARAQRLLGDEFRSLDQLGMLCLSTPAGLTTHPESATGITDGRPAPNRLAYEACWRAGLKAAAPDALRLDFPQKRRRYVGDFDHHVPDADIARVIAGT